jgi:O-antigen ligase
MALTPVVWSLLFMLGVAMYLGFSLFRPKSAVLFLPLFFPLYLWKVDFRGIPFTFIEALIYAVLLAAGLRYVYDHFSKKNSGFWGKFRNAVCNFKKSLFGAAVDWKVFLFLGLLILAAIYSTLIAPDKVMMWDGVTLFYGKRVALGILKGWIVVPVLMFCLLYFTIKKSEDILKMLNCFSVSAFILSLYALYQVLAGQYITPDARASGPFESANYLALYISPAIVYLLIRLKESVAEKKNDAMIWGVGFAVTFAALIFTKSYAAMAAIFVSLFVYYLITGKFKKGFPWKWILAVLAGVLAIAAIVYFIDPVKWQMMFNFGDRNSSSVRVQVYTISWHLLVSNWFSGIGLGQFPVQYQLQSMHVLGREPYELNMLHPHNFYLAAWLNLGLTGFFSLMGIIYLCLKKIGQLPKIRMVGLAFLVIILTHGMFDTPFFKNDLSLIFWMIAAVMLAPADEKI